MKLDGKNYIFNCTNSYGNLVFSSIVNFGNTLQYLKQYLRLCLKNREITDIFIIVQLLLVSQNTA